MRKQGFLAWGGGVLTPPSQAPIAKSGKSDLTVNSGILDTSHPIGVKIIPLQSGITMDLGRSKGQGDPASLKKAPCLSLL